MIASIVLPAAKFVIEEGAHTASYTWIGGVSTLLFLFTFVAWGLWAWLPSRRAAMDEAALLPFDDTDGGAA
jgi:cbb3-type cytochrome oxidase subunit 3